ncbi:antibiotic biosynthesis monooxygenase [Microbulbifer sp. SAOS-129_SWC]|uniref:antibiotic biosynthesis monooxygenase family protein n=1 Tax=Microbulbifer sp. SAOS-129_SWC TaxID=3145235 RepID=UPI003217BF48
MFAVIFTAVTGDQDPEYGRTVARMRELAFDHYGCLDFIAVTEGKQEIAISYWHREEDIRRWRQDAEHILAQELGRARWYESYKVEVVEVRRRYTHPGEQPAGNY